MKKQKTFLLIPCLGFILLLSALPAGDVAAFEDISAADADVAVTGAAEDLIGSAVAVGDINGDQIPDLVIGAPGG